MNKTKQICVRVDAVTDKKLHDVARTLDMNITDVFDIAVDRLHSQYTEGRNYYFPEAIPLPDLQGTDREKEMVAVNYEIRRILADIDAIPGFPTIDECRKAASLYLEMATLVSEKMGLIIGAREV